MSDQQHDPLEQLTFAPAGGAAAPGAAPQPEVDPQEAAAMQAIEAGIGKVLLYGFKVLRAVIARKLPEIKDEWPDDVLQAPADAAVPLVRKHLDAIMQIAGANPELTVFALSMLPLAMGYLAAVERHEKTVTTVTEKAPGLDPSDPGIGHD